MKYIKTYEGAKPPFKNPKVGEEYFKLRNVPHKSFNFTKLEDECTKYDIVFVDLIVEILLNKKIAFQSNYIFEYDERTKVFTSHIYGSHQVLGICEDVKIQYNSYSERHIILKVNDKWHTTPYNQKIRVYNYLEGTIAEELEAKKDAEKYNL